MANSDGSLSSYDEAMGRKFIERYNQLAPLNKQLVMSWDDLPHNVRKSLLEAFYHVADEIQGDMF
jgi:hypothetical protein